jgi:hypothetical protein
MELTWYGWRDWLSQGLNDWLGVFYFCLRSVKHLAKIVSRENVGLGWEVG